VVLVSRWRRSLPFTAADGLPILVYHKVGDYPPGAPAKGHYVAPGLFRAHVEFLHRSGYRAVGLAEVVRHLRGEAPGVERPLAITFDDGYDCLYRQALPVLQEFSFTATVFMVAGCIGGINEWDANRTMVAEPMLTAEHLVELARCGIEIGSHGMTHDRLTGLADGKLRAALRDSKRKLEDLTGRAVTAVAYPYGDHNEKVRGAAAECGYVVGCGTARGVNRPGDDPFALKRVNIRRLSYLPLFARKLRLAYLVTRLRPTP